MEQILTEGQAWAIWVTVAFIVLDVVSGIAKGAKQGQLSSSKMREGIWHKAGYVLIIALAVLIEVGSKHIDLGFTVPLVVPACVYIILSEVMSIFENATVLNPEIGGSGLSKLFNVGKDGGSHE